MGTCHPLSSLLRERGRDRDWGGLICSLAVEPMEHTWEEGFSWGWPSRRSSQLSCISRTVMLKQEVRVYFWPAPSLVNRHGSCRQTQQPCTSRRFHLPRTLPSGMYEGTARSILVSRHWCHPGTAGRKLPSSSWVRGHPPRVRTGQLCRVASSDCRLLGRMGWKLGHLLHEALHA